jgi:ABC-type polysaccharide/polyol phosphate transport system ATPase subunit
MRDDVMLGEIVAEGMGRRFSLATAGDRSLKEVLLLRRRPPKRDFWALRDIDVHVRRGEALGVVGRNGSGKSTLLKLIAGIFSPSEGTLEVGGRVGPLLDVGAGFHPDFTGVENVYLSGAIHGLSRAYVTEHLEEIIAFAELEEFAHVPVRAYSSGMFLRLGFSVAIHVQPDVLLVDEVLAVGDEAFQHKCVAKIVEYLQGGGTLVFVSHDLAAVERLCAKSMLLDQGRVAAAGPTPNVLASYHRLLAEEEAETRGAELAPSAR